MLLLVFCHVIVVAYGDLEGEKTQTRTHAHTKPEPRHVADARTGASLLHDVSCRCEISGVLVRASLLRFRLHGGGTDSLDVSSFRREYAHQHSLLRVPS